MYSEEALEKMRQSSLGKQYHKGFKHSPEVRLKMQIARAKQVCSEKTRAVFQKMQAGKPKVENSTSPYIGVYWSREKKKWHARVKVNQKNRFVGYFDCPKGAAEARDTYVLNNNLPYRLNFPEGASDGR